MSKLTDYLKDKRGKFIGLELIYNDLGVRDFLERVESEGLSEVKNLTTEEAKEMMEKEETKRVTLQWMGAKKVEIDENMRNVELDKEESKELTIKKSELGKKLERGDIDISRREEIGRGLAEFLKKYE